MTPKTFFNVIDRSQIFGLTKTDCALTHEYNRTHVELRIGEVV